MARKKLSEFTAKTLLLRSLGIPYNSVPIILKNVKLTEEEIGITNKELRDDKEYVVKVDEGVKGRMKKGLVKLKIEKDKIIDAIAELSEKGYSQFLIEEFMPHESVLEKYFSIERTREGNVIYYSSVGGIDIEQNQDKVVKAVISESGISSRTLGRNQESGKIIQDISKTLGLSVEILEKILNFFNEQYISFLEINPFIVHDSKFIILDLAVEVDNTAEFFLPAGGQRGKDGWKTSDFVESGNAAKTIEEKNIADLQANSQASLKMEVINPNGSIFVMLFGGGGSIVVADEIYNQGKSQELANYSDYSGGPKEEETVIYVQNILQLLLKSEAKKKVFIIAGTYANFTDVTVTFKGVIRALDLLKTELEKQDIKIFVRRPGPGMKKGLALIKEYLEKTNMYGGVWDQAMVLSDVVLKALNYLNND